MVTEPYDLVLVDQNKAFKVVNSEDIMIEARTTKGKPQVKDGEITLAVRQTEDDAIY